jgi:predicted choloylglycine hydrolase
MQTDYFKHYIFKGSYREVGEQHGEALRDEIRRHLELIYSLSYRESGVQKSEALESAAVFAPHIENYAPGFIEEIEGLSKGAGIAREEALLVQVRQEIVNMRRYAATGRECTAYAIGTEYTGNGKVYSGQNSDLEGDFESFSNVITFEVTGRPRIIMVIPAGQLSYQGMNEEGIGANGNFLSGNRWGEGFPRYLISRYLLEERTIEDACQKMEALNGRASSRNVLICDRYGHMYDYETIATDFGKIEGTEFLVHSNHFIHPKMLKYETSSKEELADSFLRYDRLTELIRQYKGRIDSETIKGFLRDHRNRPDCVCVHVSGEGGYHTFASIINHLSDNIFEVAKGTPCCNEYKKYQL